MPEQTSRRGNQVTKAPFEGSFDSHIIRCGLHGLNLKDSLDVLEGWARHTNIDHDNTGEATVRPGQTSFATGGTTHRAVRRLVDPQTGVDQRVWGIDSSLYVGASGALTAVDAGYSGDPLTLVPYRPPLSGDPWMFVADRSRMRKVRADGLDLPIGLPAPAAAVTSALGIEYRRSLVTFSTPDNTQAANWIMVQPSDVGNVGSPVSSDDASIPPGGIPDLYTVVTPQGPFNDPTIVDFDAWIGTPLTRDASTLSPVSGPPGDIPASDDDIIHLWLKTSHPRLIKELRIYFVISPIFDASILPGTTRNIRLETDPDPDPSGGNTDAYVKSFRQNDFASFVQTAQTQIESAESARINALRDQDLRDRKVADTRASWEEARASNDPARLIALQLSSGTHEWFELGSVGLPLRRGDFQRLGNTAGRGWSTITGMVIYLKAVPDPHKGFLSVAFGIGDLYLTGGYGPDTLDPGQQQLDYRCTHYDPRTGAEGNGSPEQTALLDSLRRHVTVTPAAAYGDAAVRQRFYRRGGSLVDDWFFLGTNTSDGGAFIDTLTDDAISAAGTLPTDHFQAVPTVNDVGATVLAQPLPALWGPLEGLLLGCGDPYRPGHLYYSAVDAPDHWSASGTVEVCPPSEALQHGGLLGHQGFVFSRTRLYAVYPHLAGGSGVTTAPTLCKRGLSLSRWAFAVGPGGIYFAADDGFFRTAGGPEEWIGRQIQPLFEGKTVNGYLPIDKTQPAQVTIWKNQVFFLYTDTGGATQVLVYSLLQQFWRHYHFGQAVASLQGEDEPTLLLGGQAGATYTHDGLSDAGLAIPWVLRTGAFSGGVREEKLLGDQLLDADRQGVDLMVQNFLNEETVTNLSQTLTTGSGRSRYLLDAFGESPQLAHSISTEISGSSATARPILYQLAYAITVQPDITNRRVTNWDDLGSPDEVWLSGVTFDCDTGGVEKTVLIEADLGGVKSTVATLTVNTAGRHKVKFSWPAVAANQVRVHPSSEACLFWILYRADWIFQPEPPRIARWDAAFENAWDSYHTGLDLYCHTFGLEKRIRVSVDGTFLVNSLAGGLTYWPITTTARQVVHLTLPWGRGHVYHFEAIDDNPGLLYSHRWQLAPEPSEQSNFNSRFSTEGTLADKWFKSFLLEVDTFGQTKQVTIELDGTVVETLPVMTSGRKVVQLALSQRRLGRVLRVFPTDGNPGRPYQIAPIFDEEPYCLDRWETEETNHRLPGWFYLLYAHVVVKSTAPVTLSVEMQVNQRGRIVTTDYVIPSTGGQKQRAYVSFAAVKGVLVRYVLSSPDPFWLYRDELTVFLQPWGQKDPIVVRPFGNDNGDPTRTMTSSVLAAQTTGGAADD